MSDIIKKPIPRLPLGRLVQSMKKIFTMLTIAPQHYPEMLVTGLPGIRTVYMVNHPDLAQYVLLKNYRNFPKAKGYEVLALLLGKGLVTNEGDNWRKQRSLIQPAFHRETLKRMTEITVSCTNSLLERWKAKEGTEINFTREMAEVTIDIVAKSLFTTDVTPEHIQIIWRDINYLNEAADALLRNPLHLPLFVPTPGHLRMKRYIAELDDMVYGIINRRKLDKNPPPDLLQLLLEARYEDGTGMTDLQIRDEVMTIFMAGHETTVNALSWTWYLLKQHEAEEDKLRNESIAVAGRRDPAFEDIPALAIGRQVMNESMRIYPPVPVVGRQVMENDEIGGYQVKAGNDIAVNIAGIHHHPAYWPEPFEFRPARFEHFDRRDDSRFIFMPFGGGPRICIGNNFAMMEMQLINAMLSARVDMELVGRDVKPNALITLKPTDGVVMRLKSVRIVKPIGPVASEHLLTAP